MSDEITIEGIEYISSKRASHITGYSQDYIGQLARAGKIIGKRVGGLWYVLESSVSDHKDIKESYVPVPPQNDDMQKLGSEDSSIVTFDGRTYVSAARAAKQTSYHQDYIGQLARSGKILSRQIGKRWFVDIEALKEHKKEKDALLGAVQSTSVGISKVDNTREPKKERENSLDPYGVGLHYSYKIENSPLIPIIAPREIEPSENPVDRNSEQLNRLQIRVVKHSQNNDFQSKNVQSKGVPIARKSIFVKLFSLSLIVVIVVISFNINLARVGPEIAKVALIPQFNLINYFSGNGFWTLLQRTLTKKITYSRD